MPRCTKQIVIRKYMNNLLFQHACRQIRPQDSVRRGGIGTLGEKTLHAVLKYYWEPDESCHEVKIGSHIADICNQEGIVEIQTRQWNKLRGKLDAFLPEHTVTLVYPLPYRKWLVWIDPETGERTKRRLSPKKGSCYQVFGELYKIKPYLTHPHLRLSFLLIDLEETRLLTGWSTDKKKGSRRENRVPLALQQEIVICEPEDYLQLVPEGLPQPFTSNDYAAQAKISQHAAQTACNVLASVGAIQAVGKQGNQILYVTGFAQS